MNIHCISIAYPLHIHCISIAILAALALSACASYDRPTYNEGTGCVESWTHSGTSIGLQAAIETGILSFDAAFLGQILLPDGRTIHDRVAQSDMLPALEGPKGARHAQAKEVRGVSPGRDRCRLDAGRGAAVAAVQLRSEAWLI